VKQGLAIGLIGSDSAAYQRADAVARIPGAHLVAVAAHDEVAAQKLAHVYNQRHRNSNGNSNRPPAVRCVRTPHELALDPSIDAVILHTAPVHNEALGLACIGARKHVLVQPPLAASVFACDRLVQAAAGASVQLGVSFMMRYSPAALLARELVDRGVVGAVDHVRASHGHNGVEYFGENWGSKAAGFAGGALMSGGGYMIDMVRWFLGDISETGGYGTEHVWRQPGSEDNGFVLMRTADGHVGQVHASWSEWRRYRYLVEIYGTSGYVRFGYSPLWLSYAQGEPRRRPGPPSWPRYHFFPWFQIMERLKGYQWSLTNMYEADMRSWINAITTGSKLVTSGHDGREVVRIAQSISRIGVS